MDILYITYYLVTTYICSGTKNSLLEQQVFAVGLRVLKHKWKINTTSVKFQHLLALRSESLFTFQSKILTVPKLCVKHNVLKSKMKEREQARSICSQIYGRYKFWL